MSATKHNLPSKKHVRDLNEQSHPYSISLYMAHIEPNARTNPNTIHQKNMKSHVSSILESTDIEIDEMKQIKRNINSLSNEIETIERKVGDVAVFVSPAHWRYFRLPAGTTKNQAMLDKKFDTSQLEKIIEDNKEFYLLSLNHNDVQLYHGDKYGIEEVEIDSLPRNMKNSLNIDELPKTAGTHTVGKANRDKKSEAFHGHFNSKEVDKKQLVEFFRKIDHSLHKHLRDSKTPLIIGGAEYLHPIYRKVNTYPHLIEDGIKGNLQRVRSIHLLEKVRLVMPA